MEGGLGSTILLFAVFLFVILGAYYTTKFISNRSQAGPRHKFIQVKDRIYLARDKGVFLLEAGDQFFLIGVTNQAINLIGKLNKEEISLITETSANPSVISNVKGFVGNIVELAKKAGNAQKELRIARIQRKEKTPPPVPNESADDEFEKIFTAIKQRKNRLADSLGRKSDNDENS